MLMYIYHLFVWSNLNFLQISQWIILPTQSCLVLFSFYANLLHSLVIWLMVSSLSLHNVHLLFCCVLSILALIWLVLTALFCAAIRRDSVFLLKFPFLAMSRFSRVRCCFTPLRVFHTCVSRWFSTGLECDWQQESSNLQNFSQYSGRP